MRREVMRCVEWDDEMRGVEISGVVKRHRGRDEVECSDWYGINPCGACSI